MKYFLLWLQALFYSLAFTPFSLIGQVVSDYKFENITTRQGLPSNNTTDFLQDRDGILWIATRNGLARYDGLGFKIYKNELNNVNSLSNDLITSLYEEGGTLWIGTDGGGLNKFDTQKQLFHRFKFDSTDASSISSNEVYGILKSKTNKWWVATWGGLNEFDLESGEFKSYQFDPEDANSISNNDISSITEDHEGIIWLATYKGLNSFDPETKKFKRYPYGIQDGSSISERNAHSVKVDKEGNVWVGTNRGGLNKLNPKTGQVKYFFTSSDSLYLSAVFINIDRRGIMWLAGRNGLLVEFDPIKEKIIHIYKNSSSDLGSISPDPKRVFVDRSEVLWIGSWTSGIDKLDLKRKKFHYLNSDKKKGVSAIRTKGDSLFVGFDNGFLRYKINGSHLTPNSNSTFDLPVKNIIYDENESVWIGNFDGLYQLNSETSNEFSVFRHSPSDSNSLSNSSIIDTELDKEGRLWIGTWDGGLNKMDIKTGEISRYSYNPKVANSISDNNILEILNDGRFLWIGTHGGGLNKFDKEEETFVHYMNNPADSTTLINNNVESILKSSDGLLWLGTDHGLSTLNPATNQIRNFTSLDGLIGSKIWNLIEDKKGMIWMGTEGGIARLDPETEEFRNYEITDGLSDLLNERAIGPNGQLFFGTSEGVMFFHPDSISENPFVPPISITGFRLYNKPQDMNEYLRNGSLHLSYRDKVFTFEFAALDFTSPAKNMYAYQMLGFDREWIYTNAKESFATYTNLDPGRYSFRVKGSNNDGVWNEEGAVISIVIAPPWWGTMVFKISMAVLALIIVVSVYRLRLSTIKKQKRILQDEVKIRTVQLQNQTEQLKELDIAKSRFFANISHEFRTPLTVVRGIVLTYLDKGDLPSSYEKDLSTVSRNSERLLQLINQLLDLAKLESGNLELELVKGDVSGFIYRITQLFGSSSVQQNVDYTFNSVPISNELSQEPIEMNFDPEKLEKIITNLLSNAFKFTPNDNSISIQVRKIEDQDYFLEVKVSNTGSEIPEEKLEHVFERFYQVDDTSTRKFQGTGIGLSLVKELTELHGGRVQAFSDLHATEFTILLPYGNPTNPADKINSDEVGLEISEVIPDGYESNYEIDQKQIEESDKLVVLVVEDFHDLRNFIVSCLNEEFEVVEASNGEKAMELAKSLVPDLVVSDVMMPIMDGYELSRELRANQITNHIPIVLLTAKALKEEKLEGLEIGVDDYLTKPFDREELLIRIKNLIKIRHSLQNKFKGKILVEPDALNVDSIHDKFLNKLREVVEDNLSNGEFGMDDLGSEMAMSRSQLHRKLKALTDQSASTFIRNYRLNKAANLLKAEAGTISEIAYMVGFNSPTYFSKSFQEFFNTSPSEYKQE